VKQRISSARRSAPAVFVSLLAAFAAVSSALAGEISSADLQIQGVGLKVVTISATTGIDIPAAIQTEFGGKQNDEAPVVEELLAVAELSGPGIEVPIRLEAAPGHKFQIPGLAREGVYFLQNIRLMKGGEFLQSATPAVATITVSNLLQTSVRVRQLTPEELRARGITIDARNYDVYEYTFSFLINGQIVEVPFPVIVDPRTHEARALTPPEGYFLPPVNTILPPRWQPPEILAFEIGPDLPASGAPPPPAGGGGGRAASIPAALVIPNSMAVLHQFFAVTLMVTNGAPDGSSVTLDGVTATLKPPAHLRTVKSNPSVAFGQPVPIVDATTGVTFLVAQGKGEADWTMEGLQPGTHTVEVDVRATYKAPGQNDFPMKGTARATVVVHDPRFNINFSHPDTVREGLDYTTFSFITNMSAATQNIRVSSGLPACADSPGANVCRVDGTSEFTELSIPAGEMRSIEYKLRSSVTGQVFATAGSVSDAAITAAVQLHMGVSESGIPLSPATLVMPYYARFVDEAMVSANLQLLGLGYSLATAPLTPALAKHPNVIKSDVFQRAVDIARAGQRVFLGDTQHDSLAHMSLDLLGNGNELREWDELRRNEISGRKAAAAISRQLEAHSSSQTEFVDRFASATAWRAPYLLAVTNGGKLSISGVTSNARAAVASEAASGWIRQLPFAEVTTFKTGELAMVGRWVDDYELTVVPTADGPIALDVILPATTEGTVIRGHIDLNGAANTPLTVLVTRGATKLEARNTIGGIAATGTLSTVTPQPVRLIGARQDLHLDAEGHKVSVLWNRPVGVAPGDDLLTKFAAQVVLNRDGVSYTGARPMSSAALQEGNRVANVTFDHALSQNASYTLSVSPFVDPLSGATVAFPSALVPVIDNDAPGGIIFGHVLQGDNTPVANAEVRLYAGSAPQYDLSRASDGAFLFEFVARDIDNNISGTYELEAVSTDDKLTKLNGAVRLPGRVHFVNLVFLGRGSAEGVVRYDNGEVVKEARVVVGSTMFDQFRQTTTDANGRYSVTDLPVGPLTFSATDADGNVTFAASEIKTPGQRLVRDLSIYRRPHPGIATIGGVVRRSDTNGVVANARVGVYTQGYGLVDGYTDTSGRFTFTKVPAGFVTVLAAEWNVSREATALDFDLAADETRELTLILNVKPAEALVVVEGDVTRENPLFPGDTSKYERVPGALVKIEGAQATTADANGHFVFPSIPTSFAGKKIAAYDPITTRSATVFVPQLNPQVTNFVPIFISTADGYGTGTVRVKLLNAAGSAVSGFRVIEPGFPPLGPTPLEEKSGGVYELKDVAVGGTTTVWAIGDGNGTYGDQTATGSAKVEFNGHVASLTLRLPGQGKVRTKLAADIDLIGDVSLVYPAWEEETQGLAPKTRSASTAVNGQPDFATFDKVPALQNFTASSAHPVYGYASNSTKLGFDGDVATITLQLNKLSTVSGVIYAVDGRTPIPGAAVRIEDGRQNPGIFTSRPDGSFEFKNVAAGVGFRVIADITQDGVYRTGLATGNTPSLGGPVSNIAVIMRTQGSIDGRVVYAGYKVFDPQNSANNVVDNTPNDLSDNAPVPLANFALKELDFPLRDFGKAGDWQTTDIAGRFRFSNVFTGPLRITAADPANQDIRGTWTGTLSQEGEHITAYVGIGATGFGPVTVRVVDPNAQNAGVANAEVTLIRDRDVFDLGTTDGNGVIRFAEVPVGTLYKITAYSKALGKSGGTGQFTVVNLTGADREVVLEFSGRVDGKLSDPEAAGRGVPGAPVTLSMTAFQTRASTDTAGVFLFEGVREGIFKLEAKDTLTNRRAFASRNLSQSDPNPFVTLELEPIETLHASVYLPNDTGGNSNVLAPVVSMEVRQRNDDFLRELQGNNFQMQGVLENETYSIVVKEIGGEQRTINTTGKFPKGSAADPLKLVLPAHGTVDVRVVQGATPSVNAKVTVSGGSKSVIVYTDATGLATARGIPLGAAYVQVVSQDNAFSGSASTTLASQTTAASVTVTLGAYAAVAGYVEAEAGGPSIGTRVIASFSSRVLEMLTDSGGRYVFNGIPTSTTVTLTYMGPNDVTVGARQTVNVALGDASKTVNAPNVKLDATPPTVVSIFPANNASNVSPDSSVRLIFSERIQSTYLNTNYLQLIPADSTTPVSTSFVSSVNADGTFTVIATPPAAPAGQKFPLKSNTLYRIVVSGEVRDLTGNKLPAPRGASFITSDYAEPQVVKVVPAVTQALQPATTFEFRWNEPIEPGQLRFYKISAAGAGGTVVAEKQGNTFLDPAHGLTLFFTPNEEIEQESFYRVVISGVKDLQGNPAATQTFHFFSYDLVKPFVNFVSPVPAEFPLISGVEYTLGVDVRNGTAAGTTATDVAKVDYFKVDGSTSTYIYTASAAPWTYKFVAPDTTGGGTTLTLRAVATDHSRNEGDPSSITWQVKPNAAPKNVAITLAPPTSIYAGNHALATVTFEDEGTFAALQIEARGTKRDGTPFVATQTKNMTRVKVNDPWPTASFDFDLVPQLQSGTKVAFKAIVTDVRGLKAEDLAELDLTLDTVAPEIITFSPAAQTEYRIGDKFQISTVVKDLETGVAEVAFSFDNQTIRVTPGNALFVKSSNGTWAVASGQITVPAKNVDTVIPITVTVKDYDNNVISRSTEVVYIGVNDPTVPKGAWACPAERAAYPANATFALKLQARATDDISVTGVKFTIPGVANPVPALRVGSTDIFEATATITTPAAGTPYALTVTISDANPSHDLTINIPLELVDVDLTVENRIQAVTAADASTYTGKTILVRGATAKFIPHVPLTLRNLLVLDGGRVETLPTTTTTEHRLDLNVTNNLTVDCASAIDVSGRGYLGGWATSADGTGLKNNDQRGRTAGNTSEGGPSTYASASHAGVGGETANTTGVTNAVYGSITNPADLGTGGGGGVNSGNAGASGGGAVKLQGSVFSIAGAIRADGNPRAGDGNAGAGGSVNVTVAQLVTGISARITANGGDDDGSPNNSRGAGGGRVAINASERFDVESVGVQVQSRGGRNDTTAEAAAYLDGGAGTIYVRRPGQSLGELFVSAYDDRFPASVHLTRPTPLSGTLRFDRVVLGQRALVRADASIEINGATDNRTAAVIDPTAVLVLKNDVPVLTATTAPVAGGTVHQGGTLGLNYAVTSAAGIGSVTASWSPVTPDRVDAHFSYPTAPTSNTSLTVPADAVIGPATLTLSARDRAGRTTQLAPVTYTVAANAPVVIDKFEAAPMSFYPGNNVTVTISAHDDVKVNKLTLTSSIVPTSPQSQTVTLNAPTVVDRKFTFAVPNTTPGGQNLVFDLVAEDGYPGRPSTTQQLAVQIIKDTVAPAVTITQPAANTLFNEGTGNTILVRATVNDVEVGVKSVVLQIGDGAQVPMTWTGSQYTVTVPVPPVDGTEIVTRPLTVIAKDYEGNTSSPSVDIRIQPNTDPNAPSINFVCATPNSIYPAGYPVKLRVFAVGNTVGNASNGIQKVEMFIGDSTTPVLATGVSGLTSHYETTFTIPADAVAGTTYNVRAVATNAAGSQESVATTFSVVTGTVISANTTIAANDTSFDNKTVIVRAGVTTIVGAHTFERLVVLDGALVTHPATDATNVHRLTFTATGAVYVSCTGAIDVNSRGITGNVSGTAYTYDPATGKPTLTGGATGRSSGSHGGAGTANTAGNVAEVYGSMFDPDEPGGAGSSSSTTCAACRAGGGVVRITAGTVHVDGSIQANGQQDDASGAGGSIRIDAPVIRGGGQIRADGGINGSGASGGGGRIAFYYRDFSLSTAKVSAASLQASGTLAGASGTVYYHRLDANGAKVSNELVADNLGRVTLNGTTLLHAGAGTVTAVSGNTLTLSNAVPFDVEGTRIQLLDANGDVTEEHEVTARSTNGVTVNGNVAASAGVAYRGIVRADRITARGGAILQSTALSAPSFTGGTNGIIRTPLVHSAGDVAIENGGIVEVNGTLMARNLALRTGANLTHSRATSTLINRLNVDVDQTITIDPLSMIDVSIRGLTGVVGGVGTTYDSTTGKPTLTGGATNLSGGSHAGQGGLAVATATLGATYGSAVNPNAPGSAGAMSGTGSCSLCKSGGGVARIAATRIVVDGKILANGEAADGAGAGGSIRVDADVIEGAGEIHADGGIGVSGASGGGGRIALYYGTLSIPQAKITALAPQSNAVSTVGAPGTVYLKADNAALGDLIVDNGTRATSRHTRLSTIGYSTATEVGTAFVRDANASYPGQNQLEGVRVVANYDRTKSWPIVSNDNKTLTVDVAANALTAAAGQPLRGLHRFAGVKLRNARLDVIDLVETTTTIDKDAPSVLLGNNQAPPAVNAALITLQQTATGSAVIGAAGAVIDLDAPVTVFATNTTSGNVYNVAVGADGSFAVPVQGSAGETITLKARDANFYALESTLLTVGTLTNGTSTPSQIAKSEWAVDAAFLPRTFSRDGAYAAVASYPTSNGGSPTVVTLSVSDVARPAHLRTVNLGISFVRDVVVSNGWAYIAADRFATLKLDDPAAVPVLANANASGSESAVVLAGGYAFTAEWDWHNDARLHIYDVSVPSVPRYLRSQGMGIGGTRFSDLIAFGSDYLIGVSYDRPGNVGRDVVVIDRRDVQNLKLVSQLDVPNFDGFRGTIVGTNLYVGSLSSNQFVVVDLSNPAAPRVSGTVAIPAAAPGVTVAGNDAFAAAGAAGVATIDVGAPAAPAHVGTNAVTGNAFDVSIVGPYLYVANELGLALVPVQVAPSINLSRISLSLTGTSVTVTGAAQAIGGAMPIAAEVRNARSGAAVTATVQSDGSFTAVLEAAAYDTITVKATDTFAKVNGPLVAGRVPFGAQSRSVVIPTSNTDANFMARNVATGGDHVIVASFPALNASDKLVLFDVSTRANPVYKRTLGTGAGNVYDVAVRNNWAYVAAERLVLLDLADPASVPTYAANGNPSGSESAVELIDGYAFTAEWDWHNDARVHIYDVSTPAAPRYIRSQGLGIGGHRFADLVAYGTDYLIGISYDRPGNIGRDVVVIDRRDIYNLKRFGELEIPNFDAFQARVVGTNLYVTGATSMAVVDLANPAAPALRGLVQTPGNPRAIATAGSLLAVADSSAGATFVDASPAGLPAVLGNQPLGGSAWDAAFNGTTLYVANEIGLAVIDGLATPPLIDRSLIRTSGDGVSAATVIGTAGALLGYGPLEAEVRNGRTGVSAAAVVGGNGSFNAQLTGKPGDPLTIKVTDAAGRVSGPLTLGNVPFGLQTRHITLTAAMTMTDSNFGARTVAADGDDLVVASFPTITSSDKLLLFDVTTPGNPVYERTLATGAGIVSDVDVKNGWAYIAAERLITLNLSSTTSTLNYAANGNPSGSESAVELVDGYAFTAEWDWHNDGRVHVYDVTSPGTPLYIRSQGVGVGGMRFNDLIAFGTDYLIGTSYDRPNNIGRDVLVIDRRDIHNLRLVSQLDIPNFDAFHGRVLGNRAYINGTNGSVAIVDLSNPAAPVVLSTVYLGAARNLDIAGSVLAVANGANGINMIDVTNALAPLETGSQPVPGSAYDVALSRGAMYVASELGVTAIANVALPPMLNESLLTVTPALTATTVTGAALAATGIAPLTAHVTNTVTSVPSPSVTVNANGSFTATVAATPAQKLTVTITDAAGRTTTRDLTPMHGVVTSVVTNPVTAADGNFRARRIVSDGTNTVAMTGSFYGTAIGGSARYMLHRKGQSPQYFFSNSGALNDVVFANGYAFFAAERIATVNLTDPAMTMNVATNGNPSGSEGAIAVAGDYAFTAEKDWHNDARIHIYNVANPAAPLYVRSQGMGTGGLLWRSLVTMGSSYLIALTTDRPGGIGHDIAVIHRTNINALVKIADIDIPNFEPLDAMLDGNTLYVAGGDAGVAIVDMTNPFTPTVKTIVNTPGIARGIDMAGPNHLAVADAGGPGVTFVDVTNKSAPVILGNQKTPGNVTDVDVAGNTIFVAGENHYTTIVWPQE
jgi:hypothetical protein